jgi:hypothetical protein
MKKIIIGLLVLIILAGLAFKGKALMEQRKEEIVTEPMPQKQSLFVSLTRAKDGNMSEKKPYLAVVQSDKSIKIATKMAGYIEHLYVEESEKEKALPSKPPNRK